MVNVETKCDLCRLSPHPPGELRGAETDTRRVKVIPAVNNWLPRPRAQWRAQREQKKIFFCWEERKKLAKSSSQKYRLRKTHLGCYSERCAMFSLIWFSLGLICQSRHFLYCFDLLVTGVARIFTTLDTTDQSQLAKFQISLHLLMTILLIFTLNLSIFDAWYCCEEQFFIFNGKISKLAQLLEDTSGLSL